MTEIDETWRAAFELAWAAFQEGSQPVGAVLVDGAGSIVASGHNRFGGSPPEPGQLSGSNIAHAEINALARLPIGHYPDHVLYTTLEPCYLCTMALRFSHIGTVRFAAPDLLWYATDQLPQLNHHLARRWTKREGPLSGPWQELSSLLNLIRAVEQDVPVILESHEAAMPATVALARRLAGPPAERLRGLRLDEAFDELKPDLAR